MSLLTALRSRRVLAGGVALAAGTASIAAPVVVPPLSAGPLDGGDADVSPSSAGATGTYESCSALFGLTDKSNASYVTFSVSGSATPLPEIGEGLVPVLTVTEGAEVTECVPEVGFDDVESWVSFLSSPDPALDGLFAGLYDGKVGYLVPGGLGDITVSAIAPELSLRVDSSDPTVSVTSDPTDLVFPTPATEQEVDDQIVDDLGGPTSTLGSLFLEVLSGPCDASDPDIQQLADALLGLTGVPPEAFDFLPDEPCSQALVGAEVLQFMSRLDAIELPIAVTANAPSPTPGPTPTPGPAPVTPAFTG